MKSSSTIVLAVLFLVGGCATTKPKSDKPAEKKAVVEPPKLVGRIASIPADKRFVLIQGYGNWEADSGRILTTRGPDDRTANLKTTGERIGEFAAADLQSGTVEVGDAVYSQHIVKPPELSTTPELPESQPEAAVENVQKNN